MNKSSKISSYLFTQKSSLSACDEKIVAVMNCKQMCMFAKNCAILRYFYCNTGCIAKLANRKSHKMM